MLLTLELLNDNKKCDIRFPVEQWLSVTSAAQRIAQRMLEVNPTKRISLGELVVLLEMHMANLQERKEAQEEGRII